MFSSDLAAVRPIPDHLQAVKILHEYTDDDGFSRAREYEVPATEWANDCVKSLLTNITAQAGSRHRRAWQYNNELVSRLDSLHRCNVPVGAVQVIRQLHADLQDADVKSFMDSYAAFTLDQRFNLAGYDGNGRETGADMLHKAHHPTGLFKARKTRERLAELQRSKPMTLSNTRYVFRLPFYEQRLNELLWRAARPVTDQQREVLDFEIQKMALILAGATPEHLLRANQGEVVKRIVGVLQPAGADQGGNRMHTAASRLGVLSDLFQQLNVRA